MAQAGLVEIMDALADEIRDALATVTDLDIQVEPRMVLSPTPPTIDIWPADLPRDPDTAAYGDLAGGYLFTVRARVNTADQNAGQELLLAFMDDTDDLCLGYAIEGDNTLAGYASSVDVRDRTGFVVYPEPSGDGVWLGFQSTVLVIPANT